MNGFLRSATTAPSSDDRQRKLKLMLKTTSPVPESESESVNELTLRGLFDSEESGLLRYAFSLVGRREVAEEIVQEVFLQLHVRWDEVDSPRAWLFRSVRNRVYDHLRRSRREVFQHDEDSMQATDGNEPSVSETMANQEAIAAMRLVIDQLDEADRRLVRMKYFDNLKYRDISDQTGLSVSNVGYRLHHILKTLSKQLTPFGVDPLS